MRPTLTTPDPWHGATPGTSSKPRPEGQPPRGAHRARVLLLLLGALGATAQAQDTCMVWTNRFSQVPGTGVGTPGERAHHAMAYDSDRGVTVFFGGEIGVSGSEQYFNDTWEYDGTNQWRQINVADPKPAPRSFHAMAYDPVRKRVVLYGGWANGGDYGFDDTWEYTGDGYNGSWRLMAGDPAEYGLVGRGMVWDPLRGKVVAVAGFDAPFVEPRNPIYKSQNAVEWTGAGWQAIVSTANDPAFDHEIWGVGAAFDISRGTLVMVGGYSKPLYHDAITLADVWELLPGLTWQSGSAVSPRAYPAAAYDERRQRVVVVGGDPAEESVIEYVPGSGWVTLPSIPPNPVNGAPSGRAGAAMVYDSRRGVFVLMGGAGAGAEQPVPGDVIRGPGSRFSDTWELVPVHVAVSQDPTNTTAQVCQSAQFSVSAMGQGTVRYQWRLDGVSLNDGEHFQGTNASQLTIQGLHYAQEGNYDVVMFDDCGPSSTVTSKVATLTVQPGLQWVLRATHGPTARTGSAMAYDSKRRVTVLFGGLGLDTNSPNQLLPLNDLWEWDGSVWVQRMATSLTNGWGRDGQGYWRPTFQGGRPVVRQYHTMAYDSRRGCVVLFSGQCPDPDGGLHDEINDTWEWDGTQWYFRTTNAPPPRFQASMAYDSDRRVAVLYGGFFGGGQLADEYKVGEWDGIAWTNKQPGNSSASNVGQTISSMAYDSFRHTTFYGPVWDGFYGWNFWNWDGANWTLEGRGFDTLTAAPSYARMVFDSYRRREVYFGGGANGSALPTNSTAFWDGHIWTMFPTNPPLPSPRLFAAMAYDSARHATVMMGGQIYVNGGPQLVGNETWELMALDLPVINQQPASQFRNPGDTAVFEVAALGPAGTTLSYTWHYGPATLLEGGRYSGATTSSLHISNVTAADVGAYRVEVSCSCGTVTSRPAFLTLGAPLQIFRTGDAGVLIWGFPDAVLQQADSIAGPWATVPGAASPFTVSLASSAKFFRLAQASP
jgi:hypothetical protein